MGVHPLASDDATVQRPSVEEVYRARYDAMVRLAHVLTAGSPAAEELVQDAFERMQQRWSRIDQPEAYLRVAVVNACASFRRRAALERRIAAAQRPVTSVDQRPDELRDAIARLPQRQRTALVLRYYEDLPEAEIARTMGCGVAAVKSLVHRAVKSLREVIEQ